MLWLATETDRAALEANVALARAEGAQLEVVEPRQLPSLEPRMVIDDVAAACWEPRAGTATRTRPQRRWPRQP